MRVPLLLAGLLPTLWAFWPAALAFATDTRAFVFTSDFTTGSLSVVDLSTRAVSQDVAAVSSDAVLRWYGGLLYVVNRFGADNIQVIDPSQGYATLRQFSVGNGSNPQDIAFLSPTKAYVSRYGSADLLIVNPSSPSGQPMSTISLAAFADGDGIPEMARMIRVGRYLFVACQRLTSFQPSSPSVVVVVDTQTDQVVDVDPTTAGTQAIELIRRNPTSTFEYDPANRRLLIGDAGHYNALDGAIEAIDPLQMTRLGLVTTEQTLGGDIYDLAWLSPSHAYAIVSQGSVNQLVSWNPTTGAKLATLFTANGGFSLPDMERNDRGELYVCKNPSPPSGSDLPGMLVFSTVSDALVAGPLDTGLPPVVVTFDHVSDQVTAAPEPRAWVASRLSAPWPNPAREATRLAFQLERPERVELAVFDVGGRCLRTLASGARPAGAYAVTWDLTDRAGHRVPAGSYFVRYTAGPATASRPVTVVP
jgi:hypothetical protein